MFAASSAEGLPKSPVHGKCSAVVQVSQCHCPSSVPSTDHITGQTQFPEHPVLLSCCSGVSGSSCGCQRCRTALNRLSERKEKKKRKRNAGMKRTRIEFPLCDFISYFLLVRFGEFSLPINMLLLGNTTSALPENFLGAFPQSLWRKYSFSVALLPPSCFISSSFFCQTLCAPTVPHKDSWILYHIWAS